MSIAAVGLVFALASPPADVTGKWEGKISASDGSGQEDTALLILTQKDAWATRGYVVGGYPGVWTTALARPPLLRQPDNRQGRSKMMTRPSR